MGQRRKKEEESRTDVSVPLVQERYASHSNCPLTVDRAGCYLASTIHTDCLFLYSQFIWNWKSCYFWPLSIAGLLFNTAHRHRSILYIETHKPLTSIFLTILLRRKDKGFSAVVCTVLTIQCTSHTGIHKHSGRSRHFPISSTVPLSVAIPSSHKHSQATELSQSFFIIFQHCQDCKGHWHLREAFH